MGGTEELILAVKNCMQYIDGKIVGSERDLIQQIKQYLVNQHFEVRTDLRLPIICNIDVPVPHIARTVDIVVKINEEYIPIEVKYNRETEDYKRYVSQIQYYVQNYSDVPCSLVMFLSRALHEKNIYNLRWSSSMVDEQSKYIIAKYATIRDDNRVFIRKNSEASAIASAWH